MRQSDPLLNTRADPDIITISPIAVSKAIYLFSSAVQGGISIFLPIFYNNMGLSDFEVGLLQTMNPISQMVGAPIWGVVADQNPGQRKNLILGLACLSLTLVISLIPIAFWAPEITRFWLALVATCGNNFVGIGSLLDAIIVEQVPKNAYGKLRLWGAIGYGSAAGISGIAVQLAPPYYRKAKWVPYMAHFIPGVACALITIGLTFLLENKPKQPEVSALSIQRIEAEYESGTDTEVPNVREVPQESFCSKLRRIPFSFDLIIFLLVIFVCGGYMALVGSFLFLFIQEQLQDGTQLIMGISVLITCSFEVPVFFFSQGLLDRVSPDWTLLISLFSYIFRFGVYWVLAHFGTTAWWIFVPEALHGLTYALMWSSAIAKTSEVFQGLGLNNFGLSILGAVLVFGQAGGSLVGGAMLKQQVSWIWFWQSATYFICGVTGVWLAKTIIRKCIVN